MNWLELLGVVLILQIAGLLGLAVYVWSCGPINLFDDHHEECGELDKLITAADEAVKNRPRVRAISGEPNGH